MKTRTMLAAAFALASFPLVAQQMPPDNPATNPSTQPGNGPGQEGMPPNNPQAAPYSRPRAQPPESPTAGAPDTSAAAQAPVADLRPVTGELISKLDTQTAKAGDDVVVQTKAAVKMASGTEIPKGSKLMGHVIAVQSSADGQNSQVALKFDHAELTSGQSVPIQSQIQSIGTESSATPGGAMGRAQTGSSNPGSGGAAGSAANAPGYTPGYTPSGPGASTSPAAGTVVATSGKIAIRTTGLPNVLLANNEPGQQDPRMGEASSILLGAKTDVNLSSGTPVVVGVATTSASIGSSAK